MRIGIAIALCALVLPATALAKGPTAAMITGPGLETPLKLGGGNGFSEGSPMAVLTTYGGFFEAAWGGRPNRVLPKSPTKSLGPKYRVVYVVPGPAGKSDRIRQDLYPYAKGGSLTYISPGQPFFDTRRTTGGWFRTGPRLTPALVAAGLPAQVAPTAPAAADDATSGSLGLWALVAMLVLAGIAALALWRRARPATA